MGSSSCPRGKRKMSIVSRLEGALLISKDPFPYLMLVALEAGGPLRALLLLLTSPVLWLLGLLRLEDAGLRLMIFVSTAGLRVEDVKAVSRATLQKFFLGDLRESAYGLFSSCRGRRRVLTRLPRIMVEPFLRDYLGVDHVIGTELRTTSAGGGPYCAGLVASKGLMGGPLEVEALRESMRDCDEEEIDIGLGDGGLRDHPFMSLCREPHLISPEEKPAALSRRDYPRPLIFHDGRLVKAPTVLESVAVAVWLPPSILVAVSRILAGTLLPYKLIPMAWAATGLRNRVQFSNNSTTTAASAASSGRRLYVCSHRTLLDPVLISIALQRRVSAVTYSLSRLSELISPIPTTRLTRDRSRDEAAMRTLLRHRDLVVCPEGTTCREPYLLRFSPLFAEITKDIVPVAVTAEGSMFYGTAVRGYKCLDCFFFLMNPRPLYQMLFLHHHQHHHSNGVSSSSSSYEVANQIQRSIGHALGFECTNLTRKDKYRMLAGTDGIDLRCSTQLRT